MNPAPSQIRTIVVSNRLPYTVQLKKNQWEFNRSAGGLVTALSGLYKEHPFHWVGWAGTEVPKDKQKAIRADMHDRYQASPVYLSETQIDQFYNGFCNQVLWPLFHYLPTMVEFDSEHWDTYKEVNQQFAETILSIANPGDQIWIHDFHLMLLPSLLRKAQPNLKIGFFLHIPFPSSEVYRLLAVRQEILAGLLGADLIGFHTYDYLRHFSSSCLRLMGLEAEPTAIKMQGRAVKLGVYPIGIDPERFTSTLQSKACLRQIERLKNAFGNRKIILGVDRMDYTKGVPLKLKAFEKFLERNPEQRSRTLLYQVAVPSRLGVEAYRKLTEEVDELVGHINGLYGSIEQSPIYYLNKPVSFEHLCALYATADVIFLTPIRDGMNLVVQEYLLCSREKRGVCVLSEFTGAAHALGGCLLVNPWDTDQVADTLAEALTLTEEERTERYNPMFHFIVDNTSYDWGVRFLTDLAAIESSTEAEPGLRSMPLSHIRNDMLAAYHRAHKRLLILDYDGTLTGFRNHPAEAKPDAELIDLLRRLANHKANTLCLISGRKHQDLETWFADLPIHLSAEHGYAYRDPKTHVWSTPVHVDLSWMEDVRPVLRHYVERTPGTFIEEKPNALVWHYRRADPYFGHLQADELVAHLEQILAHLPAETLHGNRVVEVRPQGINKGTFVSQILSAEPDTDFILCVGDDRTDLDMYGVLPPNAWTCHVGTMAPGVSCFAESHEEVRDLLHSFLK